MRVGDLLLAIASASNNANEMYMVIAKKYLENDFS
jgi:hypothetical protein